MSDLEICSDSHAVPHPQQCRKMLSRSLTQQAPWEGRGEVLPLDRVWSKLTKCPGRNTGLPKHISNCASAASITVNGDANIGFFENMCNTRVQHLIAASFTQQELSVQAIYTREMPPASIAGARSAFSLKKSQRKTRENSPTLWSMRLLGVAIDGTVSISSPDTK